ncbi:MAG: hypothetical protein JWN40_2934 [Phycisphaerales bacterium]|nr:hypothetical protein [Phycisphaerales bacterium]
MRRWGEVERKRPSPFAPFDLIGLGVSRTLSCSYPGKHQGEDLRSTRKASM